MYSEKSKEFKVLNMTKKYKKGGIVGALIGGILGLCLGLFAPVIFE